MSRPPLRGGLKAPALVSLRVLNSPATLGNRGGWFVSDSIHYHEHHKIKPTGHPGFRPRSSLASCATRNESIGRQKHVGMARFTENRLDQALGVSLLRDERRQCRAVR